ncbi:uncharacterized protein LOC136025541 [Artemia franciscana]|uniref:uncharacterized protein LOC136025541 n=1 Tax=Artemia franciscana TaxID=6661 RepID=UPI0032DB0EC5
MSLRSSMPGEVETPDSPNKYKYKHISLADIDHFVKTTHLVQMLLRKYIKCVLLIFFVFVLLISILNIKLVILDCSSVNVFVSDILEDDECLLERIRSMMIIPSEKPYNLTSNDLYFNPSQGQSQAVLHYLRNQEQGFFVEAGAFDGEFSSNTLYMERALNWTGILIEPDPFNFSLLKQKQRKSWLLPACLSPFKYPVKSKFIKDLLNSRLGELEDSITVQCFPLTSILLALNATQVDFLSLDVEGAEMGILSNLNWNLLKIKSMTVEHRYIKEGTQALKDFMQTKGFMMMKRLRGRFVDDYIFINYLY